MLKLFISYNHTNEDCIEHFLQHISNLTKGDNPLVEVWYDRNLKSGDDFWDNIDEHLVGSDIVCLLISASYLASKSCTKEMNKAIEMNEAKEARVIPIPLTTCAWLDYPISNILAATKDGKYIADYSNSEDAWYEVYQNIKDVVAELNNKKSEVKTDINIAGAKMNFSEDFQVFLNNTEILSKTHSTKKELFLDDILVHPELTSLKNKLPEVHCNCMQVIKGFAKGNRIAIVGEEQSGKTTLAKIFIKELYNKGLIPILVKDDSQILQGNLDKKIEMAFKKQYNADYNLSEIDKSKIVPIIDDFYKAKRTDDYLQVLNEYESSIIIVDDIFNLDYNLEKSTNDYSKYKIRELKPSLRVALIKKWLQVSDNHEPNRYIANDQYAQLDEAKARIEAQIDHGIMPSYPFFILFLLSTYETMEKPMDNEITTQGYCYQSLIYFFLRKQGVRSCDIDTYLNFLTEFSYAIFKCNGALSDDLFQDFTQAYRAKFNLPFNNKELLNKLLACNILEVSTSRYYNFAYPYLYYFFAGRYFAENYDEDEDNIDVMKDIKTIFENLHKNDYAYITVFIAHHTKSKKIIKRIEQIANSMFANHTAATFSAEELSFFNSSSFDIPSLPSEHNNPEEQRAIQLKHEDEREEMMRKERQSEEDATELSMLLRSSIKTVEVIGQILKNRAGSMQKPDLKRLCGETMDVHLRLLSSFFNLVRVIGKDKNNLQFLAERIIQSKPSLTQQEALNMAEPLFWNINMGVIIGFISKITNSLSSSNLLPIIKDVCDEKQTMASAIIKQNTVMWVRKSLQFDELKKIIDQSENPTAKKAMSCLLVDYCMIHNIDNKDRSRLINLGFKRHLLLPKQ